jgi:hypothetical protein
LVPVPAVGALPGASAGAVAAGTVAAGTVAAGALADSVALDAADDVPGLQADSASATPKTTAEMPVSLVAQLKFREFTLISLTMPMD